MNKKAGIFSQSDSRGNLVDEAFESLFSNHKNRLFGQGLVNTYPAGAVIFHQDTLPHAVYLIEHGLVKLVRVVEQGQSIIIGLRRRHWLMGAPAVILNEIFSYTAITMVTSSLRCIPAKDFLDLVNTDEEFSWYVHLLFAQEIKRQMEQIEAKSGLSARDRLKRFLRAMIDEQKLAGKVPSSFSMPLTNKELAQLLAITPEHLCRILKEMKQEGLVRHAKGLLTVTDPATLL